MFSRIFGACGIHTGTMGFCKIEGDASGMNIAFLPQEDDSVGPYLLPPWESAF